jgi:hypothetical protein
MYRRNGTSPPVLFVALIAWCLVMVVTLAWRFISIVFDLLHDETRDPFLAWAGSALALFLVLCGLTGAALVW